MSSVQVEYQGELRCKATHPLSGASITTEVARDAQHRVESFSPSDLLTTALGSCILTMMGMAARALKIDITGATASGHKDMLRVPVPHIRKLTVHVHVPQSLSPEHRQALQEAAHSCPVHNSLSHDVQVLVDFTWG